MSGIATATLLPDPPPRRHEEADLQRSVHQYLRWALPDDARHWATPNGLMRSEKARRIAKGQGVTAGIPDLFVLHAGQLIGIELKTPAGRLSAEQRATHKGLVQAGGAVAVCRSPEDVEFVLRAHGVPLKATVSGWAAERLA